MLIPKIVFNNCCLSYNIFFRFELNAKPDFALEPEIILTEKANTSKLVSTLFCLFGFFNRSDTYYVNQVKSF